MGALLGAMAATAESVRLAWNPNPENNIAGYMVYFGEKSGELTDLHLVDNVTSTTLEGLKPETTYYCAVSAYNTIGLESPLSEEISFTTRGPAAVTAQDGNGLALSRRGGLVGFGSVNVGALSETRTLRITNSGTAALTNLSFTLSGAATGDFRVGGKVSPSGLLAASLAPGQTIMLNLGFAPGAAGPRETLLKLAASETSAILFETRLTGNGCVFFEPWLASNGLVGGSDGNPDGDGLNNLLEFAFGTDPKAAQGTSVTAPGGTLVPRGAPGVRIVTTPAFEFQGLFSRRKDHAALGLGYRPQFSADLIHWTDATATPVVASDNGEMEVVSVRAPAQIDGKTPRFFRLSVDQTGPLALPEWLAQKGVGGGANGNPDGDGLNNLFEFAFGTDPAVAQNKVAAEVDGLLASRGAPTVKLLHAPGAPDFEFRGIFCRRKDRLARRISYQPQFSADLMTWANASAEPVVRADDGEIEVVSVLAPAQIGGRTPRFFRVAVTAEP